MLDGASNGPEQQELALESLLEFTREPALMLDVYINYDCDVQCTNLFETICHALSGHALPRGGMVSMGCVVVVVVVSTHRFVVMRIFSRQSSTCYFWPRHRAATNARRVLLLDVRVSFACSRTRKRDVYPGGRNVRHFVDFLFSLHSAGWHRWF